MSSQNDGKNLQIPKINVIFFKNCTFLENYDFFSCDFVIFYGTIGCAIKFYADHIIQEDI